MRFLTTFFLFFFISYLTFAQVNYSYDGAGNRILRKVDAPDLIITLTVLPSGFQGSNPINGFIRMRVIEVNNFPTNGSVIAARLRTSTSYSINLTPGSVVSSWTYQGVSGVNHIFTSNLILNNSASQFNLPFTFYSGGSTGTYNFSASILIGSGGELNGTNNSDQETVSYNP